MNPAAVPGASPPGPGDAAIWLVTVESGANLAEAVSNEGGRLLSWSPALGVAMVEGPGDDGFRDRLSKRGDVAAVERDGLVRIASASSAGARWDGARWDEAALEGARWDEAALEGARWDGARWDGARWDGARWDDWDGTDFDELGRAPVPPWGLFAIRALTAWESAPAPAHARTVCMVDTGIDASHPALRPNLWRAPDGSVGRDFVNGDGDPEDEVGHGTHVAGILAAARDTGLGFAGVGSPLVATAKVFGATGLADTSAVIAGIGWCTEIEADVILLALTEEEPTRAFRQAVDRARRGGALIVASAGNQGPCGDCVSAPARYPGVLAVGALAPDGYPAPFSATGKDLDLLAPGVGIVSAFPGGSGRIGSGTSQAAAFAAGAAAYLWSLHPDWSPDRVEARLLRSAEDTGGPARDPVEGWGLVNLAAATLPDKGGHP